MSPATTREVRPRRTIRSAPLSSQSDATQSMSRGRTRPVHRKTDHSVIERRRREKINNRLLHLQYMVPACRDQAREHFRRKMQDDSDQNIQETLALEKLCIISHTVDYLAGLQEQLTAYKSQCECLPVAPEILDKSDAHDAYAHEGLETCSTSRYSPYSSSLSSESKENENLEPIESQSSEKVTGTSPDRSDSVEYTPRRSMPSLQHLMALDQPQSMHSAGSHHHQYFSGKEKTDRVPYAPSYRYHPPYTQMLDSMVNKNYTFPRSLPASHEPQSWFLRSDSRRYPHHPTFTTYPRLANTPHRLP